MRFFSLNQLPLYVDDFFFKMLNTDEKDALVIQNPMDAITISPVLPRCRKSLQEHIDCVNNNGIKKVVVVAEDISFLKQCPGLECLMIYPAVTANDFDYSPLYELENIKWLSCDTIYGIDEEKWTSIDYSHFKNLKRLHVGGAKGNLNVDKCETVEKLILDPAFPKSKTLTGFIPGKSLKELKLCESPVVSLEGIEVASKLVKLELSYNRRLVDISALANLGETLKMLEINTCGRIHDFSVLSELHNLEYLILRGNNTLPNISFLRYMPNLKVLDLRVNVEDGDLTLCESLPYVRIKNHRHYTHKNDDLPKDYTDPKKIITWYT